MAFLADRAAAPRAGVLPGYAIGPSLHETPEGYELHLAVPGRAQTERPDLAIQGNVVTILWQGLQFGQFRYTWQLPMVVERQVRAYLDQGMLRLVLPKEAVRQHLPLVPQGVTVPQAGDGPDRAAQSSLYETAEGYELHLPLPGVQPGDVELSVQGDTLTIRGKPQWTVPKGATTLWRGLDLNKFEYTYRLPTAVQAKGVQAVLEQGILRLVLPKAPLRRELPLPGEAALVPQQGGASLTGSVGPSLYETPDYYELHLALPGVQPEQLDLAVQGDAVMIQSKPQWTGQAGGPWQSLQFGEFGYTWQLPGEVDERGVKASLEQGVLRLVLPKARPRQQLPRHIPIESSATVREAQRHVPIESTITVSQQEPRRIPVESGRKKGWLSKWLTG